MGDIFAFVEFFSCQVKLKGASAAAPPPNSKVKSKKAIFRPSKAERKSRDRLSWQSEHKMFFVFSVIKRIRPLLTQSTAEVAFGRSKKI